jgi:hypothetical protein
MGGYTLSRKTRGEGKLRDRICWGFLERGKRAVFVKGGEKNEERRKEGKKGGRVKGRVK